MNPAMAFDDLVTATIACGGWPCLDVERGRVFLGPPNHDEGRHVR